MMNFTGREESLNFLEKTWKLEKTRIICLYGRRRVGKTELVYQFASGKEVLLFEGLEGEETEAQIQHFLNQMARLFKEPHLADLRYKTWPQVFDLLTQKIFEKREVVVFLDELPWMAAGRGKMVSLLKYYWDQKWKTHPHLLLILCGSVATWMVKNVVHSKALYGRVSHSLLLEPLKPFEVAAYIGKKRGQKEIMEYLLCFGGIPKYLEEFDFNKSIQINIDETCFRKTGFFVEEAQKIFYSQFREALVYRRIAKLVSKKPLNFKEISESLEMESGGGLKVYLDNLVMSGILEKTPQIRNFKMGKTDKYVLSDEFLRFHLAFIEPHLTEIKKNLSQRKFDKFVLSSWASFLGRAFEQFCMKHRFELADLMGFGAKVVGCGPVLNNKPDGYQYDLVFIRKDSVLTLCEVKYQLSPVDTFVIRDMEQKIAKTVFPRGVTLEKVLISNQKPMESVLKSGYFHKVVTTGDIVSWKGFS